MFSSRKDNDSNPNTNTNYNDSNASSYGAGSGSSGRPPHKSSLLNKLDPRVDSSIGHQTSATGRNDGGALVTSPRHDNSGFGISNTGHGDTSGYGTGSAISGRNTGATSAGPHDSSLANKMDPRVDSDVERGTTRMSRDSGYNTQHNSGYSNPPSHTGYGASNTTSGPHSSNLANKADPRVDSDNSRGNYGTTTGNYSSLTGNHGSNTTGTGYGNTGSTTVGPHSSNFANKADPRVDSDNPRGNYGNPTGTYNNSNTGSNYGASHGETSNAGPHKTNPMNKLDPRVDSDMDSSRNTNMGRGMNQGLGQSMGQGMTGTMPQEISSHGHATGGPAGALEGKHAKHTSGPQSSQTAIPLDPMLNANTHLTGNISNATASAKVTGGMVPEGSADASGPLSADAGTTTSNQGGLMGAIKNLGSDNSTFGGQKGPGPQQGEHVPKNRNY